MKQLLAAGIVIPLVLSLTSASHAELLPWGVYVPKRSLPPVVFVTGHDAVCPDPKSGELPFFNLTFGQFDKIINATGRVAMVFELCYVPNRPGLDVIAARFSELTKTMLYDDGEPVREIDIIAHNIGGLMVRSYIAQGLPGPRVRKAVFLGVPNFGTTVAAFTDQDPQLRQSSPGSRWLFDLATWNQGKEDLRGAEAIALAGTAGVNRDNGPSDSVVTVTSASLDFVASGRTAVLPLCHTQGGIGQLFLCDGAVGLASVRDADHPTARIVLPFLNGSGSDDWRAMAQDATTALAGKANPAGLMVEKRTAQDVHAPIQAAGVTSASGSWQKLSISSEGVAFTYNAPSGPVRLTVDDQEARPTLVPGGSLAVIVKPGPLVSAVEPLPSPSRPLVLAPGMLVRIRGKELRDSAGRTDIVIGAGEPVRVLSSEADGSLIALLPDVTLGTSTLTVRNGAGQHSVRMVLEPSAPAFLRTESGSVGAVLSDSRDILTLYLTGLGAVRTAGGLQVHVNPPEVNVDGHPCSLLYSGRAGTLPGVDQINCRLARPLEAGASVELTVRSGGRAASARLEVR